MADTPVIQCDVSKLPQALTKLPQWVVWRLEPRETGKPAKVPYDPRSGSKAKSDDPTTWATFAAARAALTAAPDRWHGLGFYFFRADPYVGIDLDDAIEDGVTTEWAQAILEKFPGAYVETSQSGRGLHIIARGTAAAIFGGGKDGGKKGKVEVYVGRHYLAVTGAVPPGHEPQVSDQDYTAEVVDLCGAVGIDTLTAGDDTRVAEHAAPTVVPPSTEKGQEGETRETVLAAINASKDGLRFFGLFEADSQVGKASEEDLQLACIIARHTRNEELIVEIMASSARRRLKWSEKRPGGITWLRMTVRQALTRTSSATDQNAVPTFKLYTTSELDHITDPEWLIRELVPAGALAVLYGPSEGGKSFLALKWALELARDSRRVVYVASEGWFGMKKRVQAWCAWARVAQRPEVAFLSGNVNLLDGGHVAAFRTAVHSKLDGAVPDLVVIDTLNQNMPGGDENNAKDMSYVIAAANALRRDGTTVLILHHPRKSDDVERGHSSLRNAADTMLQLVRDDVDDHRVLRCTKQKDAAPFPEKRWALVEHAGSMVLEPRTGADFSVKLLGGVKVAMEVLQEIEPATQGQWEKALVARDGKYAGSFGRWLKRLIETGLVIKDGAKYRVASTTERARAEQNAADDPNAMF
jgi:hypothetical protein